MRREIWGQNRKAGPGVVAAKAYDLDLAVGERGMGHYTCVTQTIRRMSRRPGRKLEKIKRQPAAAATGQLPNCCEMSLF